MRRFLVATRARLRTAGELIAYLWDGPYWWLVPVVLLLSPFALLFLLLQAAPVVAPFVYTVF